METEESEFDRGYSLGQRDCKEYYEFKLQALKEEVEELAEFRVKYFKIERMQNSDGTEVEAQAVLKEDVLNLITNLEDK